MPVLKFWNPATRRYEPASGPVGVMGDAPGVRAYNVGYQSVPSATNTALALNTEEFDTHGFHDNAVNNSRLTVPAGQGGIYRITGHSRYEGGAGVWALRIRKNGSIRLIEVNNDQSYGEMDANVDTLLVPGDYIELEAYHAIAGAQNWGFASASEHVSMLSMVRQAVGQPGPRGPAGISEVDAPGVVVRRDTVQSVASGTNVKFSWSVAEFDSHGFWNPAAPTRLTVPAGMDGRYLVGHKNIALASAAGQRLTVQIWKNGVAVMGSQVSYYVAGAIYAHPATVFPMMLAAGDYIEADVFQDIASPRDVGIAGPSTASPLFWLIKEAVGQPGPPGPTGPAGTVAATSGVTFPAVQVPSADPNTLDDYEEGSWTPVWVATSGAATYVAQLGRYIKVGRLVTAWFNMQGGGPGTLNGNCNVSMPFPAVNLANYWASAAIGYYANFHTTTVDLMGWLAAASSNLAIGVPSYAGAGGVTPLNQTFILANFQIIGSISYMTDA